MSGKPPKPLRSTPTLTICFGSSVYGVQYQSAESACRFPLRAARRTRRGYSPKARTASNPNPSARPGDRRCKTTSTTFSIFDLRRMGETRESALVGYREATKVRAGRSISWAARTDLDSRRFGLWGYNLGAYAALREAENDKRIRALVLDSVYDEPKQMVKVGVERNGLGGFPLMVRSAEFSFEYLNYAHSNDRRSQEIEYAGRRPDAVHSGGGRSGNSRRPRGSCF